MTAPLLDIEGLSVDYVQPQGRLRAVDSISLSVNTGELLGVAGESGCGKSTLLQAALRILPAPGLIAAGAVRFEGKDLLAMSEEELRGLRFRRIGVVFQAALESLHPTLTIGAQLRDVFRAHHALPRAAETERIGELLRMVGLEPRVADSYPHQLSGGMRQRVGIASALSLAPSLLVLDEPTTALDVMVEHAILGTIVALQRRTGFSTVFISHDLARMAQIADRIAILYAGRLVELAPADALRRAPRHPYTQALLGAFPTLDGAPMPAGIPGSPPSLRDPPGGCRFHPRCALAIARCREEAPALVQLGPAHSAACHLAVPDDDGVRGPSASAGAAVRG